MYLAGLSPFHNDVQPTVHFPTVGKYPIATGVHPLKQNPVVSHPGDNDDIGEKVTVKKMLLTGNILEALFAF
jgi:hypothetical protein